MPKSYTVKTGKSEKLPANFDSDSVVDPNSFFSDSEPQIIFFGFRYGFGFLD
jgi:hypothetical protein